MTSILINGLGRSGTSWVHKTFDQHPSVFASFEPEALLPREMKLRLQDAQDETAVQDYVDAVFSCRGLRAMRKRPILRKAYRSEPAHLARVGYIYAASALLKIIPGSGKWMLPIPDMAALDTATYVVKSVSQQYELARITRETPDIKVIYIIRHPCGQVFSHMNGIAAGKMTETFLPPREDMGRLFEFDIPAEDLNEDQFTQLEINAYRWAVFSDANFRAIADLPNARIIRYEDLCADPPAMFRDLFEWAGLDWHPNCRDFLEQSLLTEADATAYHALVRNPLVAANKWRETMAADHIETVKNICQRSAGAALYPDLLGS